MPTGMVRGVTVGALSLFLVLSAPVSLEAAANKAPTDTLAAFVASAEHGLAGTYSETYRLNGPSDGTVEVFQRAPRGANPFPTGGTWSFLFQAKRGISSQWIENKSTAWDCWRAATEAAWTCSGPGTFHVVNGFLLAIQPYVPGVVSGELNQLNVALKDNAPQVRSLTIAKSTSPRFGPLECLSVAAITSCIDHSGVLVSQRGGSYWSSIVLVRRTSSLPRSAFHQIGTTTSEGSHFTVVPS